MEEAGREIHAGWRWDLGNGKSTYPEMPITMAGGLVPWLMRHQLRWVVRRSRSSSCNCSNIGNPRRRNKCIVGRAIADDDFQNSKLKKEKFYLLPAKFENLISDLLQYRKICTSETPESLLPFPNAEDSQLQASSALVESFNNPELHPT